MTEQEAIQLHISENIHRIEVIEDFLSTNSDANDKECRKNIDILTKINKVLEEVQQYRAIGTPEECRSAVEKQIPKKPVEMKPTDKLLNGYFACPMCGGWVGMDEYSNEYCGCCGQKLDWSDNNEKL